MRLFAALSLLTVFAPRPAAGQTTLPADAWREDLRLLAERLPEVHANAFHTLSEVEFEAAITALDARIPALEEHEIVVELMRIGAMIGDGHTALRLHYDDGPIFRRYPIGLMWLEDGVYLTAAEATDASAIGGRLVRIDGTDIDEAWGRVREVVHRDNEMGVRSQAPLFMQIPEVLDALGIVDDMESATFTVEIDGGEQTIVVAPVRETALPLQLSEGGSYAGIEMATVFDDAPTPLWLSNVGAAHWYRYLPDSATLYVQSNRILPNDDGASMAEFYERAFAVMDSVAVRRLVIDLRLNGGGNLFNNFPVIRSLVRKPWIDEEGRLFVIIGRQTFSAASHLVTYIEGLTPAVFVGEPTGASPNHYGDPRPIRLPNSGLELQASTIFWQNSLPPPLERRDSTTPDVAAPFTIDALTSGRDPALEAILAYEDDVPITERLEVAARASDFDAVWAAWEAWRDDPRHVYLEPETEINALGYRLLGAQRVHDAIEVLQVNNRAFPESPNTYDSLAEANMAAGRRDRAIELYESAVSMDPDGPIGANARRMLERLRAGD